MWHADEAETSLALHLYPEWVDMDKAVAGGAINPLMDKKWKIAPGQAAEARYVIPLRRYFRIT